MKGISREKHSAYLGAFCAGRFIRAVCSVSIDDLPWVISSKALFLNKIRIELDPVAFRCLELWYYDRVQLEKSDNGMMRSSSSSLNLTFYESLDFVKHHL
jgi:hypothetical protein